MNPGNNGPYATLGLMLKKRLAEDPEMQELGKRERAAVDDFAERALENKVDPTKSIDARILQGAGKEILGDIGPEDAPELQALKVAHEAQPDLQIQNARDVRAHRRGQTGALQRAKVRTRQFENNQNAALSVFEQAAGQAPQAGGLENIAQEMVSATAQPVETGVLDAIGDFATRNNQLPEAPARESGFLDALGAFATRNAPEKLPTTSTPTDLASTGGISEGVVDTLRTTGDIAAAGAVKPPAPPMKPPQEALAQQLPSAIPNQAVNVGGDSFGFVQPQVAASSGGVGNFFKGLFGF